MWMVSVVVNLSDEGYLSLSCSRVLLHEEKEMACDSASGSKPNFGEHSYSDGKVGSISLAFLR